MAGLTPFPKIEREGKKQLAQALGEPFIRLSRLEMSGGLLLIGAAVAAMIWANWPEDESYHHLWHTTYLDLTLGEWGLHLSLGHWINDLVMAVFFLMVGLEIKREIISGELSSVKKAAVPICAAVGGMAAPAVIFAALNRGGAGIDGWGVPMATDIAFALGVLAMLGGRAPRTLMVFLMSLAIVDDLGALLVIAVFYTDGLNTDALFNAALVFAVLMGMNFMGVRRTAWYLIVGLVLWYFVYKSGVHATIAGVVLAIAIPEKKRVHWKPYAEYVHEALDYFEESAKDTSQGRAELTGKQQGVIRAIDDASTEVQTPLRRLEITLVPWSAFVIVPIFALANAGVRMTGAEAGFGELMSGPVFWGVALGLVIGKVVGVFGTTWLAVKLGIGAMPTGVTNRHILGASFLAGIGFTMALFIANLAFKSDEAAVMLSQSKLAVLSASVVAGVCGVAVLYGARPKPG